MKPTSHGAPQQAGKHRGKISLRTRVKKSQEHVLTTGWKQKWRKFIAPDSNSRIIWKEGLLELKFLMSSAQRSQF
jgi:hypothetical protein